MFQLAFGLGSDSDNCRWYNDIPRSLLSALDNAVYTVVKYIYAIFFNIADSQIINSQTISDFYSRVQLILGVIMIFKLAVSLLQVIINPDLLNDQKQGVGKIIVRIVTMLAMFAAITPLNIQGNITENSYEDYLNKNGLLFGTMYSLQHRILENNTIAKLILGNSGSSISKTTEETNKLVKRDKNKLSDDEKKKIKSKEKSQINAGDELGAYILKVFIRPNTECTKRTGDKYDKDYYDVYNSDNTKISDLIDNVNAECHDGTTEKNKYIYAYFPFIPTIVGIIVVFCLLGFCVDIAIRAIKLAVLRLIAPIPIISYINPKSSENGSFANWVKMVTTTYLDVFIRLSIIYFVIFIINSIIKNGIDINMVDPIISGFTVIFIIVGLFFFAGQAPKFIKDALGLKNVMGNVGLSSILGGAAALTGGAGIKGALAAGMSTAQATNAAAAQGKAAPPAWQAGSDLAAQIKTGDPKARGGVMNAINDRLMRDAGINVARKKYGVTAQGLDIANEKMHKDQDAADKEKDLYDRFNRGQVSEDEMNAWAARNNVAYDSSSGTITDSDGNVKTAREAIYDSANNLSIKAAKSKKNYEEAKKFADSHRVTPSFEEEHRASLRERFHAVRRSERLKNRPDMFNDIGEGATAHQRLADRIWGSRENWSDSESDRTDNRWSPGTTRGGNENAIHDNPDRTIDTPQAGPPPGGPHP